MRRIERLAAVEPTKEEMGHGAALMSALVELESALKDSRVGADTLELSPPRGKRILVLPTGWIQRILVGTGENDENEFYRVEPIRGRTQKPFLLSKLRVGLGYSAYDSEDQAPVIRGEGPAWVSWPNKYNRHVLHYQYAFDLGAHALAVTGEEDPLAFEVIQ